jgi:hypothetical protein
MRAMETVKPNVASVRWKNPEIYLVVPEMTAVSKPNRKPPSADTTVVNNSLRFINISFL